MAPPPLPLLEYKAWRKKYGPMMVSAKRAMADANQRNILEAVAAAAFQGGFAAGRDNPTPKKLKLHPWNKTHPLKKLPRNPG